MGVLNPDAPGESCSGSSVVDWGGAGMVGTRIVIEEARDEVSGQRARALLLSRYAPYEAMFSSCGFAMSDAGR